MNQFPAFVQSYALVGQPQEVPKPPGAARLTLTVTNTIHVAGGGNAGPIPEDGIDDGTGTFHVHPTDSLDARTWDVTSLESVSFFGDGEVALIWGF